MRPEVIRLHGQLESGHWWFVARRRILLALVHEVLPPSRDRLIVDVGCGTGANVDALGDDYECIGIDTSAEAIATARRSFPRQRFLVGHAPADLGEDAGRADLFLLMDVLEHVEDDRALFRGIMAVARPGALALITVPAQPGLWSEHDISHMHYRRYTPDRLAELWRDAPIRPMLFAALNTRLYPLIRLARTVAKARGRAVGRAGSDLAMPFGPVNALLTATFAGEAAGLIRRLRRGATAPDRPGVSMLAIVRREEAAPFVRPHPAGADVESRKVERAT